MINLDFLELLQLKLFVSDLFPPRDLKESADSKVCWLYIPLCVSARKRRGVLFLGLVVVMVAAVVMVATVLMITSVVMLTAVLVMRAVVVMVLVMIHPGGCHYCLVRVASGQLGLQFSQADGLGFTVLATSACTPCVARHRTPYTAPTPPRHGLVRLLTLTVCL